jgi:LemA protein
MGWVILGILVLAGIWAVSAYNGFVQLKVRADSAWSDIDVQLKRRYDLIPNLVETVKGYAGHEQKVFASVTEARSRAMSASAPAAKGQAEQGLAGALKTLFAVAESYPQLRASENFQSLQGSLSQMEEAIQDSRRYYNAVVRDYNTKLGVLPDAAVGRLAGFQAREFFQPDSAEERKNVKVSF